MRIHAQSNLHTMADLIERQFPTLFTSILNVRVCIVFVLMLAIMFDVV